MSKADEIFISNMRSIIDHGFPTKISRCVPVGRTALPRIPKSSFA